MGGDVGRRTGLTLEDAIAYAQRRRQASELCGSRRSSSYHQSMLLEQGPRGAAVTIQRLPLV